MVPIEHQTCHPVISIDMTFALRQREINVRLPADPVISAAER
jgi:hypothetical protein